MNTVTLDGLDLRHLQALRAVAAEGTFGRAAVALGYTQSAVSQQIAGLERIVGHPVFDRPGGPRPVKLTAAGRLLLGHAEQILDRVDLIGRDLAGFREGSLGRIDVGVFQSVAVKLLPAIVGRLRREAGSLDVRPFEANDDRALVAKVLEGELDLTFVGAPVHEAGVEVVHLADDPYVAVTPSGQFDGPVVPVTELAVNPLVGQPTSDSCQVKIDAGLVDAGITPDYVFRTNDNAALQSMVRAGMGVAVMPLLAVDLNDRSVDVKPIDPPIPHRTISLAIGPNVAPVVRRFVELAIEVCAMVVEQGAPGWGETG